MSASARIRIIGEVRPDFAARLRELDRRGAVEFHGAFSPSELGDLLAEVDAAVLPSMWWDCAPLAAAECLAARVPLVVPRLGGLPEAVRDEVDGLVYDALDGDDLARKLDRLAEEPGLLERLQQNISAPRPFADYVDELEAYYDGGRSAPQARQRAAAAPAVRWKGDFGLPTSLAIINDAVTGRLSSPVQRVDRGGQALDPPLPHPADVEVRHHWPPDFSVSASGRLATIVPWEFGAIPGQWLPEIQANVDEVWVPSDHVRRMYLDSGIDASRVHVVPNGVDLNVFAPARDEQPANPDVRRFLYVGGVTGRKGIDILLRAWDLAFADRDDVVLVIKAAMAAGAYGGPNEQLRERAAEDRAPRIELIEDDLDTAGLAELYRSCDIFVLPYRGEGFAMPVLEAMASGLPVITTAGGPTDEFCPAQACWRIRSERREMPIEQLKGFEPDDTPWMLEPDLAHLTELLATAAATPRAELASRGRAGRVAAERYSWDAITARYQDRIAQLATAPTRMATTVGGRFPLSTDSGLRVLATPAWRGEDQLADLLREWGEATGPDSGACLYLLADPASAGVPEQIEARVIAAAEHAELDLDECADIEILIEPFRSDRDPLLHRSVDAYVPLHAGCAGHVRLAEAAMNTIIAPGRGELVALIEAALNPVAQPDGRR
jgi:glycosyltransferase involved in cell wall biosynthesis